MTETRTIRWGISSTGHIAGRFASDMAHARNAELAGVASRDLSRARSFAARFGCAPFPSIHDMAASDAIDAIYVASPHTAHCEQALIAIEAGKAVLVEKPLTADPAEARRIAEAAATAGVFLMEGLWSRFLPAFQAARETVRYGTLGAIRRLDAELAWLRDYDPEGRFFSPRAGGGALFDLGVYTVSLGRFLLGAPTAVDGNWTAAPTGVDVSAEMSLRFGETEARLRCGFDRNGDNRLIVEGEKATLVLGLPFIGADRFGLYSSRRRADLLFPGTAGLSARLRRKAGTILPLPGAAIRRFDFPGSGLQFQIEAASRAIAGGRTTEPDCTPAETIATLDILDEIRRSPPSGSWLPA